MKPANDADHPHDDAVYEMVVVSNRLPVDYLGGEGADTQWKASPGGLVTALEPIMRAADGAWVGWTGVADREFEPFVHDGISIVPVPASGLPSAPTHVIAMVTSQAVAPTTSARLPATTAVAALGTTSLGVPIALGVLAGLGVTLVGLGVATLLGVGEPTAAPGPPSMPSATAAPPRPSRPTNTRAPMTSDDAASAPHPNASVTRRLLRGRSARPLPPNGTGGGGGGRAPDHPCRVMCARSAC